MQKPLISFVAMARNDDYGGNWINRINAFLKVLAYQAKRVELPIEIILVEYNPVLNKEFLHKSLSIPKNQFFSFTCIVVPNEFHKTLPNNDAVQICEFIAKNIGIRRAKSDYVLATNPDVLFSNELFDFFASKKIQNDYYYRINRRDTSISFIDENMNTGEILALASKNVIKTLYNDGTTYHSWKLWWSDFIHGRTWTRFMYCPAFNPMKKKGLDENRVHENAAGDFLLMHKNLWEKVRGYDQMTVGSGVMDGYIMYALYCLGYNQKILPYSLFHLNHHHGGVKYLASQIKFREDANKMLATKVLYKVNSPDWGFPNINFKEINI